MDGRGKKRGNEDVNITRSVASLFWPDEGNGFSSLLLSSSSHI